jgi:small-conductance mechanosensitive channel
VRIGEVTGDVVSLGFFATKLRTIRNEEVTLPNGQVAAQAIVNYTRLAENPGLVLHTEVTIGYDVDWRKVHALLIGAAGKVEGIEKEPAPQVFQRSLNDYHVSYELTAVTHLSHPQLRLYSDLHQEIQDAFAAAGVEILSPAFHAIRDAPAAVLPGEPKGARPGPGAFRVETKGTGA